MYSDIEIRNRSFLPKTLPRQLNLCKQVLKVALGLSLALLMTMLIVFLFSLFPILRDMKHGYKHVKNGTVRAVDSGKRHGKVYHQKLSSAKLQGKQTLHDAKLYLSDAAPHIQIAANGYRGSALKALNVARAKSKIGLAKASREAMPILATIAANTAPNAQIDQSLLANSLPGKVAGNGIANLVANFGLDAAKAVNLRAQGQSAAPIVSRLKNELRGAVGVATQGALTGLQTPVTQPGLHTTQKLKKQLKNVVAGASAGAAYGANHPVPAGYSTHQTTYAVPTQTTYALPAQTTYSTFATGPSAIPGLAALVANTAVQNAGIRAL